VREIKEPAIAGKIILVFLLGGLRIMVNGLYQFWIGLTETKFWIETYTHGELGARLLNRLSCGRVFSTFVYPNAYAGFLIILIPLIFSFFCRFKGYKRSGAGVLLGLSFFSLYITYSKGGWLSLALTALAAFIFLFSGIKINSKIFILLLSLILIFGLIIGLQSTGSKKLGFIESFNARWEYWKASVLMIRDNPLRGYGLGNFGEIYAQYKLPMAEETQMAHNNYLQVWVETGLAGFLILLWFVFSFLRLGIFSPGDAEARSLFQGAFWGAVAFFIHGLVDFDLYVPNLLFSAFFLIGIAGALNSKSAAARQKSSCREGLKCAGPKLLYALLGAAMFLTLAHHQTKYAGHLFALERINNFVAAGDFDRAETDLKRLLEEREFNPRLHFEKGRLSEIKAFREKRKSDFIDAVYAYRMASNLNPHRAGYHFRLGRLYWALRDEAFFLEKAVSEFKLAHELYPAKAEYKKVLKSLEQYLNKD
jgi:O-antigen ligase